MIFPHTFEFYSKIKPSDTEIERFVNELPERMAISSQNGLDIRLRINTPEWKTYNINNKIDDNLSDIVAHPVSDGGFKLAVTIKPRFADYSGLSPTEALYEQKLRALFNETVLGMITTQDANPTEVKTAVTVTIPLDREISSSYAVRGDVVEEIVTKLGIKIQKLGAIRSVASSSLTSNVVRTSVFELPVTSPEGFERIDADFIFRSDSILVTLYPEALLTLPVDKRTSSAIREAAQIAVSEFFGETVSVPVYAKTIELTHGLNVIGVGEVARKLSAHLSTTSHGAISSTPEIKGNVITFKNTIIGPPIYVSLPGTKSIDPVAHIWSSDPEDLTVRTLLVLLPDMLNGIVPGLVKTQDTPVAKQPKKEEAKHVLYHTIMLASLPDKRKREQFGNALVKRLAPTHDVFVYDHNPGGYCEPFLSMHLSDRNVSIKTAPSKLTINFIAPLPKEDQSLPTKLEVWAYPKWYETLPKPLTQTIFVEAMTAAYNEVLPGTALMEGAGQPTKPNKVQERELTLTRFLNSNERTRITTTIAFRLTQLPFTIEQRWQDAPSAIHIYNILVNGTSLAQVLFSDETQAKTPLMRIDSVDPLRTNEFLIKVASESVRAIATDAYPEIKRAESKSLTSQVTITLKGGVRPGDKIAVLAKAIDKLYLPGVSGQKSYIYEGETGFNATGMTVSLRDSDVPLLAVRRIPAQAPSRLNDTEITLSSSVVDGLPQELRQGEAIKKELDRLLSAVADDKDVNIAIASILSGRTALPTTQAQPQDAKGVMTVTYPLETKLTSQQMLEFCKVFAKKYGVDFLQKYQKQDFSGLPVTELRGRVGSSEYELRIAGIKERISFGKPVLVVDFFDDLLKTLPEDRRTLSALEEDLENIVKQATGQITNIANVELRNTGTIKLLRPLTETERSKVAWRYMEMMGSTRGCTLSSTAEITKLVNSEGKVYGSLVFSPGDSNPTITVYAEKTEEFPDRTMIGLASNAIDEMAKKVRVTPLFEEEKRTETTFEINPKGLLTPAQNNQFLLEFTNRILGNERVQVVPKENWIDIYLAGSQVKDVRMARVHFSVGAPGYSRFNVILYSAVQSRLPAERCFRHIIEKELLDAFAHVLSGNASVGRTSSTAPTQEFAFSRVYRLRDRAWVKDMEIEDYEQHFTNTLGWPIVPMFAILAKDKCTEDTMVIQYVDSQDRKKVYAEKIYQLGMRRDDGVYKKRELISSEIRFTKEGIAKMRLPESAEEIDKKIREKNFCRNILEPGEQSNPTGFTLNWPRPYEKEKIRESEMRNKFLEALANKLGLKVSANQIMVYEKAEFYVHTLPKGPESVLINFPSLERTPILQIYFSARFLDPLSADVRRNLPSTVEQIVKDVEAKVYPKVEETAKVVSPPPTEPKPVAQSVQVKPEPKPVQPKPVVPPVQAPKTTFDNPTHLAAQIASGKTGVVYQHTYSIPLAGNPTKESLDSFASKYLKGCRLISEWTGNLNVTSLQTQFSQGRGRDETQRVKLIRSGPVTITSPQVIVREYSGPVGSIIKLYSITGTNNMHNLHSHTRSVQEERERWSNISTDARKILITASSKEALEQITCSLPRDPIQVDSLGSVSSPTDAFAISTMELLKQVRQIGDMGRRNQPRRGRRRY
jgi:hypothetical protein